MLYLSGTATQPTRIGTLKMILNRCMMDTSEKITPLATTAAFFIFTSFAYQDNTGAIPLSVGCIPQGNTDAIPSILFTC